MADRGGRLGSEPPIRPGMGPGAGRAGGPMHGRLAVQKPKDMRGALARLWAYFRGERGPLWTVFAMVLAGSAFSLVAPWLSGRAIDAAGEGLPGLVGLAIGLGAAYLLNNAASFLQGFLMAGVSQRTVKRLRAALFDHLQGLPVSFFDARQHGDLMSRLTNDIDNISSTISSSASHLMSICVTLLGSLGIMLAMSPLLTVAILIPAGLGLALTRLITKRTRPFFQKQQRDLGGLSAQMEETVSGLLAVRGFNHERAAIEDFSALNDAYYRSGLMALIWSGFLMPMMNVINNLSFALVGGVGCAMAASGWVSVGVVGSFVLYSRQFSRPLNDIANVYNTLQTAVAGAERVFEIFDQATESPDGEGAVPLADVRGDVRFEGVRFGYRPDIPVIRDVGFVAPSGSSIALVGPTGAGKTTVVNLLARFYELDEGSIEIDGRDIREYTRESLRRAFGIVLQDTYLFSGTIRENIRYGDPEAGDARVEAAAERAGAGGFIERLPNRYDTILSESGSNLSAGQRQLLAIARAILADSPILILDEATSNVDTRTELNIQRAMLDLMANRTTFIIAHRLSTIRNVDRILVIDGGRIVEQGSHADLIRGGGIYGAMWRSQLRNTGELA